MSHVWSAFDATGECTGGRNAITAHGASEITSATLPTSNQSGERPSFHHNELDDFFGGIAVQQRCSH